MKSDRFDGPSFEALWRSYFLASLRVIASDADREMIDYNSNSSQLENRNSRYLICR